MTERPRVAAIVPARNEGDRIEATVRALRGVPDIDEVIVVDDASSDATAQIAANAGARAFRLVRRHGKGGALTFGVSRTDATIVVFADGDLGDSASLAAPLLRPVLAGDADMTIARPPASGPSGFGIVERLARLGILMLAGLRMHRPLSGQRAVWRAIVEQTGIAPRFGVETALTIDVARAGWRVVEIPVELTHRRTGRTLRGFAHRARQGLDVAAVLLGRAARRRRRARA